MQIHEPRSRGHTTALHHQIEGRESIAEGRHQSQHRKLGLQHSLLQGAESWKAELREARALCAGQPETASQANNGLGHHHTDQQMQRRQLQHGKAQIKSRNWIDLVERHRQESRQPEAPTPSQRRGRAGQGRGQADPQSGEGPKQQRHQQPRRQGHHDQRPEIGQHGNACDHLATEGSSNEVPGLHHQIGESCR